MSKDIAHIIANDVDLLKDKIISYRRRIHQNPELSFNEKNTSIFVYDTLKSIGIENVSFICETGVVALITSNDIKSNSCIAFRADLDALPIIEENESEYKSKNIGVMHACGHDAHTAILLGLAEVLWKNKKSLKKILN